MNKTKYKTIYKTKYEKGTDVYNIKTKKEGKIQSVSYVNRRNEQCYCIKYKDNTTEVISENIIKKMIADYDKHFDEKHKILKHLRHKLGAKRYNSLIHDIFDDTKSYDDIKKETKENIKTIKEHNKAKKKKTA